MTHIRLVIIALVVVLLAVTPAASTTETAATRQPPTLIESTWLTRTQYGYEPVEQAQPTLWIEGQPHTRFVIDRPGMERAMSWR
jgi:hypothetical protein